LPSAIPLVAPLTPGRGPTTSFVLPNAPAPPPLAPVAGLNLSSPLLRMPSMSHYGGQSPTSPHLVSPSHAKSPRIPHIPLASITAPVPPPLTPVNNVNTQTQNDQGATAVQHNAKLDNILDWANDVYSTFSSPDASGDASTSPSAPRVTPAPARLASSIAESPGAAKPEFMDSPFDSPFDAL
jgi:hypothetical protein